MRHRTNIQFLWEELEKLNLELIVPRDHRLPSVTTVAIPQCINHAEIRRRLLDEFNIEIAGGLGAFKDKVWRIGLMGYSSRRKMWHLWYLHCHACDKGYRKPYTTRSMSRNSLSSQRLPAFPSTRHYPNRSESGIGDLNHIKEGARVSFVSRLTRYNDQGKCYLPKLILCPKSFI